MVTKAGSIRLVALASLITLGIAISYIARFKLHHAGLQFVTDHVWISSLGIHYKLGLDGLNVALAVDSPGPMTQVKWSAALYLDSRATHEQRDALRESSPARQADIPRC